MIGSESSAACRRPEELCVKFTHNSAYPPRKFSYNSNYTAMRSLSRCSRAGQNIVAVTKIIQLCTKTGPTDTFQKLLFSNTVLQVPETASINGRGRAREALVISEDTPPVLLQTKMRWRNVYS